MDSTMDSSTDSTRTGNPEITGTTRLFAVIGDPVAQVQAPSMVNPLFVELGTDAVLVPVHARPENLRQVITGLQRTENVDGLLITVPHKAAALRFADLVSPAAELSGGTNAIRRAADGSWQADNFDGEGFVRGLLAAGHNPYRKRIALAGAGGAGRAIAVALLLAGAELDVWDRDMARVGALVSQLEERWPGRVTGSARPRLAAADIAVNATPAGLGPQDPLPFDPAELPDGAVVADIIMKPRTTPLLRAAQDRGLRIQYGAPMLSEQLALYREFFGMERPAGRERLSGRAVTAR
ncbi:shikimate dehydrogenase [Streptomyces sp. H10-C2]|uniref:shikimate dehydrogenase family protein n=1 Tax=unclassified Streptomyces TaxID=2593676 RepID=UPI0024B9FAF1|nr:MULTISPECIES: shikimate dehydrogenase [unclassified Streptomyces]MDJ0346850.1 shikimate dehydrogenase [Streptomyces sp. PH10-H1]MDJ0372854.1 shikimate dehydrogenase [Streptomyces sp. H10-C2]